MRAWLSGSRYKRSARASLTAEAPEVPRIYHQWDSCQTRRVKRPADKGSRRMTARARRRMKRVDMLRSLPTRAYLALASARDHEEGQAMVEYGLLLFLIAVVS